MADVEIGKIGERPETGERRTETGERGPESEGQIRLMDEFKI